MWTEAETQRYRESMDVARSEAVKLGTEIASTISKRVVDVTKDTEPDERLISPIFDNLILAPIFEAMDYGYDTISDRVLGGLDLYIGRKCKKIIPLLLEIAKRLNDGNHRKRYDFEGGGSDHYYWVESYSPSFISLRWDTQTRSYYINLTSQYAGKYNDWKLNVVERKCGQPRREPKERWKKEPGYVLNYAIDWTATSGIDDQKAENTWLNLPRIKRFFDMINVVCVSLGVRLYQPPFVPEEQPVVA